MAVITVSRQAGSGGDEIVDALVRSRAYRCLDKGMIEAALREDGIPPVSVERYDEKNPRFFRHFARDKDIYLHHLKSAVLRCACEENAVILGRGGHVVLESVPGVLAIRFIAPKEARVRRIMEIQSISRENAEHEVTKIDHARDGFHKFFYGTSWDDPSRYDLVFNTENLSERAILRVIDAAVAENLTEDLVKESRRRLADLVLQHEVVTQIIYRDRIPVQNLEVSSEDGNVLIRGLVMTEEHVNEVEMSARKVAGVEKTTAEVYYIPSYTYVLR